MDEKTLSLPRRPLVGPEDAVHINFPERNRGLQTKGLQQSASSVQLPWTISHCSTGGGVTVGVGSCVGLEVGLGVGLGVGREVGLDVGSGVVGCGVETGQLTPGVHSKSGIVQHFVPTFC